MHRRCRVGALDGASVASAKRAIKSALAADEKYLQQLKTLGKAHGATGEVEDVAGGLKELMESTLETATSEGNDSDFYEAHAVLLNLKRKQMGLGRRDAGHRPRPEGHRAPRRGEGLPGGQKETSTALTKELAAYAVQIAGAAA